MPKLTARTVEQIKAEPGKRREIPDDAMRGLTLRITETGAKSWSLRYRTSAGAQRRMTLGGYPAVSLAEARDKAQKALGAVADGRDVAQEKQNERRTARTHRTTRPQTLAQLWVIYARDVLPRKRERTRAYQTWLWSKHLLPRLGPETIATLDRATTRAALKEIGETAPTTANRALGLVRHMLNTAVEEEYLAANPLAQMGALFAEESRDRVLNDAELRALWRALDAAPAREDLPVSARMSAALKLVLLTAARPAEVAGIHASEIDIQVRSWTIPGERFKAKRPHTIPLSNEAWKVLREAYGKPPEKWAGFAFPHARDAASPMRRMSLSRAMQRVVTDAGMKRATAHDLRRTAATYLASERVRIQPHVVTAVLGHAPEGPAVTAIYNRHRYDTEKRAALEAWALLLKQIVAGKRRPPNVTSARKTRSSA